MIKLQRSIHHLHANLKLLWRNLLLRFYNLFWRKLPQKQPPTNPESILIMVQEKLGDAILTFPLIKSMHKKFPQCEISLLATAYNNWLFSEIPFIKEIIVYKGNKNLTSILKHRHYQIFYYLKDNPSFTGVRISQQVKAEIKICLDVPLHNKHFDFYLPNPTGTHIIEKNAILLQLYDTPFPLANWFPIPADSYNYITQQPGLKTLSNFVAINISSGSLIRRWTQPKWSELLGYLKAQKLFTHALIFAVGSDINLATTLKKQYPEFVIYPNMTRNLYDVAVIISKAKLLISPDTSLVHIAAAVNTPVVTLYNHTERNYTVFAPYRIVHRNVISPTRYISDIEVTAVIKAYEELLTELQI